MVALLTVAGLSLCGVIPLDPSVAAAQSLIAVRGAIVHTAAGLPIANATIIVRVGKLVAVGQNFAVPAGAQVFEVAGKTIVRDCLMSLRTAAQIPQISMIPLA